MSVMRLLVLDELILFLAAARCRVFGHRWQCVLHTEPHVYYRCRRCHATRIDR